MHARSALPVLLSPSAGQLRVCVCSVKRVNRAARGADSLIVLLLFAAVKIIDFLVI